LVTKQFFVRFEVFMAVTTKNSLLLGVRRVTLVRSEVSNERIVFIVRDEENQRFGKNVSIN
jgi:hypothetical protein